MLRALTAFFHSMFLRTAFCSQGEHKRETVKPEFGHLVYRCSDCGHTREIGPVFYGASNRRVRS